MGYTWGQLRFQLGQSAPSGVGPDLIDEFLNIRYSAILDFFPWKGLEVETYLQTVASYTTGTITATQGSPAIVGVGTTFTAGMTGYRIQVQGRTELYRFTYFSPTTGTLDRPFEGTTIPGATFILFQNIYALPPDCKTILEIDCSVTGLPLQQFSKMGLSAAIGPRVCVGDPTMYAVDADSAESTPPVLHAVELYPLPQTAVGLPFRYAKAALSFDGDSPSLYPLPFVSTQCLLNGVRADIRMHLKDYAGAQLYEAKYESDLRVMVRVDEARKGPKAPKLPAHYTNYRQRRTHR